MDIATLIVGGAMLILVGGVSAEGLWRKLRSRTATAAPAYEAWQAPAEVLEWDSPAPPQAAGFTPASRCIGRYVTPDMEPNARKHTAVAGVTGDGKTTTMNSLLVADIAVGAQCVVCSTHFTYYHPDDQRIDLRPLRDAFQVAYTAETIRAVLAAACALKDQRMTLYRAGKPVGHDVCLYFGEWDTSIQRLLGAWATERLQEILDEGRKTNIWVSFVEVHGAQVKRFGGDSALRAAFRTRLTGNVDATSWRAFVGSDIPQQPVPQGQWMTERGPVFVEPPTAAQIAQVAAANLPRYAPLGDIAPTPDADRLLGMLENGGKTAETFQPAETSFQASESEKAISVETFQPAEIAKMAALIAGGNGKTESVKAMPGYTGRRHSYFGALYEFVKSSLDVSA